MNQERFEEVEQLLEWIPEKEKESVRKALHSSEAFQQFDQKRKSQFIRNSLRFFGFPSKQSESFSMEF